MSFNILPKNVIEGTNSDGKSFRAFEYDFGTFATLQTITLVSYVLAGGLFCAIMSPIILVMLMLQFTGRFNIIYLTIPIFSGYFIYDCANGWVFSALLNIFIEEEGLVILAGMNVACIVVIAVLTLFGKTILNTINAISHDVFNRYVIFFMFVGFIFCLSMAFAFEHINIQWLGVTKIINELHPN